MQFAAALAEWIGNAVSAANAIRQSPASLNMRRRVTLVVMYLPPTLVSRPTTILGDAGHPERPRASYRYYHLNGRCRMFRRVPKRNCQLLITAMRLPIRIGLPSPI